MRKRRAPDKLTSSEYDVLKKLATGKTNQEIARLRNTSPATIQNQVHQILSKLGVSNRTEATFKARQNGLLDENDFS